MKKRYVAFYKPYGHLSQFTGEEGQLTLDGFDLPADVYAAGRLDKDSEGLLVLSNDGTFINRVTDPKNDKEKYYWVQVEGTPGKDDLKKLSAGVSIKGKKTKPCRACYAPEAESLPPRNPPIRERKNIPTTWLQIVLTEGMNRQVRRMTAAIGFPTLRLIRVRIGKLELGDLSPGKWRDIVPGDVL